MSSATPGFASLFHVKMVSLKRVDRHLVAYMNVFLFPYVLIFIQGLMHVHNKLVDPLLSMKDQWPWGHDQGRELKMSSWWMDPEAWVTTRKESPSILVVFSRARADFVSLPWPQHLTHCYGLCKWFCHRLQLSLGIVCFFNCYRIFMRGKWPLTSQIHFSCTLSNQETDTSRNLDGTVCCIEVNNNLRGISEILYDWPFGVTYRESLFY